MRPFVRRWTVALGVLAACVASAESPDFSRGRVIFGLQYGPGIWALDQATLAGQVGEGNASTFISEAKSSHTASLRLGYNILGHATVEGVFTATGWDLATAGRGGAGFLAGLVHWHPLMLVWRDGEARPAPFDASIFFGLGYGIAGQDRGMDGRALQWGFDGSYYFGRQISVDLFFRDVILQFDKFYLDYYARDAAGNTVPLPNGSGGAFLTLGVGLTFHFET